MPCASPACPPPTPPPTPTPTAPDEPTTTTFTSPSGNILCSLSAVAAVCEVVRHSCTTPPEPADCGLDHGSMVSVGREAPAEFLCYGDTGFGGQDPVLGYGEGRQNESFVCTSRRSGMTCERVDGSAGVELSRERYRLL